MNLTSLLTILSFLIFSLTTYFPLVFPENIYDTDGYPLAPGENYYILPTNTSEGGGVMLSVESEIRAACPLTVNQKYCKNDDGLLVIFNVTNGGDVISEESNLQIEFVDKKIIPECAHSSKWSGVVDYQRFDDIWITIGDSEDLRGIKRIDGRFKIKKQGLGYKLQFSPEIGGGDLEIRWLDIKRFNDVNGRRLVAPIFKSLEYYYPFEVKFINANRHGGRTIV
jgi:hypothetical protein